MAVKLSPPWFTFANEVKYTYGMSPYVKVKDLVQVGNGYELRIYVCDDTVAHALRQVLPLIKDFGGVIVNIIVYNSLNIPVPVKITPYTPQTLARTLCNALHENPLFVGTILTEGKLTPQQIGILGDVVVIIKKRVVQFYDDNISDICSNYNQVAATTFADVSNLSYPVNLNITFSTYDSKCIKSADLYCGDDDCWCCSC